MWTKCVAKDAEVGTLISNGVLIDGSVHMFQETKQVYVSVASEWGW